MLTGDSTNKILLCYLLNMSLRFHCFSSIADFIAFHFLITYFIFCFYISTYKTQIAWLSLKLVEVVYLHFKCLA